MNTNNIIYIYLIDKIKFIIYNVIVFFHFPSKKAFIYPLINKTSKSGVIGTIKNNYIVTKQSRSKKNLFRCSHIITSWGR